MREPRLAVDLGCGPGHTTRLLHETLRSTRTVGLDRSAAFVALAKRDAPPGADFIEHDARWTPFPVRLADVIFCRLLLAHLVDPADVVARWVTQLIPTGTLLLDELESIETREPAVRAYLDEVATHVVVAQGAVLLAGPLLHAMPDPPGAERVADGVVEFTPEAAASARIFAMNLDVLGERGETAPRPDLAAALDEIASDARPDAAPVIWRLRQLALRRTE
ncbi:MAG: methyltransferase domain-containing protein [Actinomycetota bacterium]|nr:methyltransferase domain-containing protein [Actinomycetota bacterium]